MTDKIDTLIAQLQSPDVFQRSEAVLQLQPDAAPDDRAIAALVAVLCADDDLNVVEDATWVVVRYGKVATAPLLQAITHDSARARHNIVHALGKMGDADAVPALMAATEDVDVAVRLKAAYALGQIRDPRALEALVARLDDPVQDVQWTAREVIESFGAQARPQLIQALTVASAQVRELAASLLGEIGDSSSVDPLMAALDTDDWQVRFAIVEALGAIGDARARPAVARMAEDGDARVRAMAHAVSKMLR
jgi:HEAT repeat protein